MNHMSKKNLTEKERWEKCNTCGDYEYCAGNYGTDKCTGYIPGNPWDDNDDTVDSDPDEE